MTTQQQDALNRGTYTHCLEGPIEVGDYFAWEPLKPHAFCIARVTKIEGEVIWSYTASGHGIGKAVYNDEARFREACVRIPICPILEVEAAA